VQCRGGGGAGLFGKIFYEGERGGGGGGAVCVELLNIKCVFDFVYNVYLKTMSHSSKNSGRYYDNSTYIGLQVKCLLFL